MDLDKGGTYFKKSSAGNLSGPILLLTSNPREFVIRDSM